MSEKRLTVCGCKLEVLAGEIVGDLEEGIGYCGKPVFIQRITKIYCKECFEKKKQIAA